jgi:hypothetical protein
MYQAEGTRKSIEGATEIKIHGQYYPKANVLCRQFISAWRSKRFTQLVVRIGK